MDNAQRAIMIGVGLFITILIIAAVMLIVTPAINLINNASNRLGNLEASLVNQLTAQYDETTVTGNQVIAAVTQYYYDENMIIEVQAMKNGDVKDYGKVKGDATAGDYEVTSASKYDNNEARGKLSQLTDSTSPSTYVPVNASFKAHLIKNGDAVVGIIFERN